MSHFTDLVLAPIGVCIVAIAKDYEESMSGTFRNCYGQEQDG